MKPIHPRGRGWGKLLRDKEESETTSSSMVPGIISLGGVHCVDPLQTVKPLEVLASLNQLWGEGTKERDFNPPGDRMLGVDEPTIRLVPSPDEGDTE